MTNEKIFLDDNIILDFLICTRKCHKKAVELFTPQKDDEMYCYSFGSISDIVYVYENRYKLDKKDIVEFYEFLSTHSRFECLSLSDEYLNCL